MGTDSPVEPGSASNNQPSCSPRPIETNSKTQPKTANSSTLTKTQSKIINKMGGTVASKHSLNQSHLHITPLSERCPIKDSQPKR